MIDESPTTKTEPTSLIAANKNATPITSTFMTPNYSKNNFKNELKESKRKRASSTSPIKRFIQKAPPPPENVFNTHKGAETARRQQRQQQRRERKKEQKEQYKYEHPEGAPTCATYENMQHFIPTTQHFQSNVNVINNKANKLDHVQMNIQQTSCVPYEIAVSTAMQHMSCPQCPPHQFIVIESNGGYVENPPTIVEEPQNKSNFSTLPKYENEDAEKEIKVVYCDDEKMPRTRTRSKSIHCHDYISPLYREEIVTVVDDCHKNLIRKPEPTPRSNMIQRRSRSSSGVNTVVLKNWPDHNRQNSYETVIAALEEENLIINKVDYYPEDERYPTASMPLHSRLSTSNEALVRPSSTRPDVYQTMKSCVECNDQHYQTRSLHRRQASGGSSKKRNRGVTTNTQVIN